MSADPPTDELTPAERRVSDYLGDLRREAPPGPDLAAAGVVRAVRWQRAVRAPLQAAGMLALALTDGLRVVLGVRRDGEEPR